jgi:hypothetical protein
MHMGPKELSEYFTSLLRSEAEVIASFLMGVLLTVMLAFSLRRLRSPGSDNALELVRKEAEIARKDTELARKDAQIAGFEARLASLEEEKLVAVLRRQDANRVPSPPNNQPVTEQFAALEARCARMEADNRQLKEAKQSVEEDAANLRMKLAHALSEADHWAKWWKVFDEENARLREAGSLSKR